MAQRLGRGIALLFHDRGTRRGWVVSSTPGPHCTPGKDPVPILQEAGWVPGPVWMGRKSCLNRDSILDHRYTNWATRPTNIYIYKHFVWTAYNLVNDCDDGHNGHCNTSLMNHMWWTHFRYLYLLVLLCKLNYPFNARIWNLLNVRVLFCLPGLRNCNRHILDFTDIISFSKIILFLVFKLSLCSKCNVFLFG